MRDKFDRFGHPIHYEATCEDCGKKFVYADSCQRHRAVCAVRLRALLHAIVSGFTRDDIEGASLGLLARITEAEQVLSESGQGR